MTLLVIQAPINPIPSIKLLGMQEVYIVGNEELEQRALTCFDHGLHTDYYQTFMCTACLSRVSGLN